MGGVHVNYRGTQIQSRKKKSWNKDPEGSQKSPKSNMQSKMHFPSLIILLILSLFFSSFNLIFLSEELFLPFKRNNVVSSRIIGKYSAEVHSTCFTLCDNVLQSFQLMWKKKAINLFLLFYFSTVHRTSADVCL